MERERDELARRIEQDERELATKKDELRRAEEEKRRADLELSRAEVGASEAGRDGEEDLRRKHDYEIKLRTGNTKQHALEAELQDANEKIRESERIIEESKRRKQQIEWNLTELKADKTKVEMDLRSVTQHAESVTRRAEGGKGHGREARTRLELLSRKLYELGRSITDITQRLRKEKVDLVEKNRQVSRTAALGRLNHEDNIKGVKEHRR